jgi:hypothetical protein
LTGAGFWLSAQLQLGKQIDDFPMPAAQADFWIQAAAISGQVLLF